MTLARLAIQLKCASRFAHFGNRLPALWLPSDTLRLPDPRNAILRLPAGSGFIFRHYDQPGREAMARGLLRLCRKRRIMFLLAGDWRMALRVAADGVHFPEGLAHQAGAMRRVKPDALVTVAAHGLRSMRRARHFGADAILLSPVFATQSHPGAPALGPVRAANLMHAARLPIIALGGMDAGNARRLKGSGAAGIAGISGLI